MNAELQCHISASAVARTRSSDDGNTLKLPLSVSYALLLKSTERAPAMDIWLSQDVAADYDVVQLRSTDKGQFSVVLERRLSGRDALRRLASANLNIDMYVLMQNAHGEIGRVPAGVVSFPLAALFNGVPVQTHLVFPMIRAADGGTKAELLLTLSAPATLGGAPLAERMRAAGVKWAAESHVADPLAAYIGAAERRYSPYGMRSAYKALNNVNMFEFIGRVGRLPAAAYIDTPLATTDEAYYLNVARLALQRHGVTEAQALRWDLEHSAADARVAAYWLADALSIFVQYCDYFSDEVVAAVRDPASGAVRFRTTPIEWFQYVRTRNGAGDCEDLATEMVILAGELELVKATQPLVRLLQRINAAYYTVLLLDGVSNAEIAQSAAAAGGVPTHMEAHMNSALVSRHHVERWLSEPVPRSAGALATVPVIVMLEGTGPLDPDGLTKQDEVAEALRDQMLRPSKSVRRRVRQIFHYNADGKSASGFYQVVKLMCCRNIDPHRFIWLLYADANTKEEGISFMQIAAGDPRIRAVAEEPFSEQQLALMRHYKRDLHPMPSLYAPSEQVATPEHVERGRAQMVALAKRIEALVQSGGCAGDECRHHYALIAKYQHFDANGQFAEELYRDIERQNRDVPLVGFEWHEERATQDRGGYYLQFRYPEVVKQ